MRKIPAEMATWKLYTTKDLRNALAEVREGSSMRSVAHKYSIFPTTLHDHLSGKSSKVGSGGPTVLTSSEGRDIALTCMALANMGYGLTRDVVAVITCVRMP